VSELILIAGSGLAREVLAMVRSSGQYDVVGVLDDDKEIAGLTVDGAPVLGTIDDAPSYPHAFFLVCLESGKMREAVVERLSAMGVHEARYATAIDPSVSLGGGVRIGRGAQLGMNSSVRARTSVGAYGTVGMGAAVLSNVPGGETWVGVPAHELDHDGFQYRHGHGH
jgi:hypothetical protein